MGKQLGCAFVYEPTLSAYQLAEGHPFKPLRIELCRELLRATGHLTDEHEYTPRALDKTLLTRVHDPHYVELVKRASRGEQLSEAFHHGLGTGDNPIFPEMHQAIALVCAASVTALDLVASGQAQRALNLSGGLHHAQFDKASGFCVYNDLAVAIVHGLEHYDLRVAYVDLDAHHGDGVQWLFYDRPEVMTISLHESGRYLFPGTGHTYEIGKGAGRGLSVNMPLEPFTEDASFLEAFEAVVPTALRRFQPDLIVLQAGADMHRYDPLADLSLSTHAMARSYQRMSELADELCGGRLVATGGGGYDPYRTVPRAWTQLWCALSRQTPPGALPEAWRARWQARLGKTMPESAHDLLDDWPEIPRQAEISSHNRAVVKRLLATLEPIWLEQFGPAESS